MNQQQTYRGSSFYIEWMRDTLVYDNPLSKLLQVSKITKSSKEQEVFLDLASWLQNNLVTARINLDLHQRTLREQHWAQGVFKISEFCN